MRTLILARERCQLLLPGLLEALAGSTLSELEARDSPGIAAFRKANGPALLVPEHLGGAGASPRDVAQVMQAVGASSPSLAVATAMHHFSTAALLSVVDRDPDAEEAFLLAQVASDGLLMSSAGAEGYTRQRILEPALTARRSGSGFVLDGSKRPCSLARSMDLLTATVGIDEADGSRSLGIALVPADSPGLSVHPFWCSPILAGAESEEVRLEGVEVPEEFVVRPDLDDPSGLDEMQAIGFIWFQLIITAAYHGAASALVERVIAARRGSAGERVAVGLHLEAAGSLIEGMALAISTGVVDNDALARSVMARYAVQDALRKAADGAVELLGGMAFIDSPDVSYLSSVIHALPFHPPSRSYMTECVDDYLAGQPFRIV